MLEKLSEEELEAPLTLKGVDEYNIFITSEILSDGNRLFIIARPNEMQFFTFFNGQTIKDAIDGGGIEFFAGTIPGCWNYSKEERYETVQKLAGNYSLEDVSHCQRWL